MGHKLTDKGAEPDPSKVEATKEMPRPRDKVAVHRFLGMCQYLSKFGPSLSETVLPLRDLTKQDAVFVWSNTHQNAFNSAKKPIVSAPVLRYYDPSSPVTLQVDASKNAIGGVLLQENQPMSFTSHTIDATEKKLCPNRERMSRDSHLYEQMASISINTERGASQFTQAICPWRLSSRNL